MTDGIIVSMKQPFFFSTPLLLSKTNRKKKKDLMPSLSLRDKCLRMLPDLKVFTFYFYFFMFLRFKRDG